MAHITMTIDPNWFLITQTSTHIILIFVCVEFLFTKLFCKVHVVVVKIGVKSKIQYYQKSLQTKLPNRV